MAPTTSSHTLPRNLASRIAGWFQSPAFVLATAAWTLILLVWGTLEQAVPHRAAAAFPVVFDTWLVHTSNGMPLPGMPVALTCVCLWLAARLVAGPGGWRSATGLRIVEAGLLLLLVGRALPLRTIEDARLTLVQGAAPERHAMLPDGSTTELPFTARLVAFERRTHPGSQDPSHYASQLEIVHGSVTQQVSVAMNRPFRHRGYGLFQVGYVEAGPSATSVLGVTRRPLRLLPAVATALVAAGLLAHALRRRTRGVMAVFPLLLAVGADAAPTDNRTVEALAPLPIQAQGRIMPLDTFERLRWRAVAGRAAPADSTALAWLAQVWFDPQAAVSNRLILVQHAEAAAVAQLAWSGRRLRASFIELAPARHAIEAAAASARNLPAAERGAAHREVLRLDTALHAFETLPLLRCPGLVPVAHGGVRAWIGLADALSPPWNAPTDDPGIATWRTLGTSYADGDGAAFAAAAARWEEFVRQTSPGELLPARLRWEVRLNRLDPFRRAGTLCLIAWLAAIIGHAAPTARRFGTVALVLAAAAFALLSTGLVLRTFLSGRPPVTNLHTTFVFAAWTATALGLAGARRHARPSLLAAPPLAFVLLRMSEQSGAAGDSLGPLAPILDTNVWLGLHVTTIMVGFAACLLAAAIAHVALLAPRRWTYDADTETPPVDPVAGIVGAGLAFTLLGTLLGGLWAEVSWGRFWGWDPKENGALAVIVWFGAVWVFARCGTLGARGTALAAWVGGWVVMAAWQGVNLLGAGRHSYGFDEGGSRLLAAFALDAGLLAVALARSLMIGRRAGAPLRRRIG